uniref:arylamine N-acetyltransferase n=1 Tax=Arion vulgaris TaxID=1028688 RepID=A0A0B7B5C2_9EUPU
MELLTKEEGLQYLQNVLRIPISEVPNFSEKSVSAETKLSFLETLLRAFLAHVPFQSIYLMSHDINNRRRPTWDEIKRDILSGRGGLCYSVNAFMYALLASLELNAGMTFCTFNTGANCPDNHLLVLLHDLVAPGSLHLVDVGLGYFVPHALSLDFTNESQEYTDSFMTYKLCKESESVIYFMKKVPVDTPPPASSDRDVEPPKVLQEILHTSEGNKQNDARSQTIQTADTDPTNNENQTQKVVLNGAHNNKIIQHFTWLKLYFFNPLISHKKLEPFFPCFDYCFTDFTKLSTHTSPRAMFWPNGKFVCLVNSRLIQEKEEGKLTKTNIIETVVKVNPLVSRQNNSHPTKVAENKAPRTHSDDSKNTLNETPEEIPSADTKNEHGNHSEDQNKHNIPEFEPLVQAYEKYFPTLPTQMVRAALRNWTVTGTICPVPQHLA